MITLGIDPGFARCGYAFIESKNSIYRIVESGLIETFKETEYNQRLKKIYNDLNNLIKKIKPDNAAIEELFFSKNSKTALKEYKPKEVKSQITGNGNANKNAVIKMINLFTSSKIIQDDTADAVAIALAHASRNRIFK